MALIVEFEEFVEARRRRQRRRTFERCVELFEINLEYARWMSEHGPAAERPLYFRRAQHLLALRDYAVRAC